MKARALGPTGLEVVPGSGKEKAPRADRESKTDLWWAGEDAVAEDAVAEEGAPGCCCAATMGGAPLLNVETMGTGAAWPRRPASVPALLPAAKLPLVLPLLPAVLAWSAALGALVLGPRLRDASKMTIPSKLLAASDAATPAGCCIGGRDDGASDEVLAVAAAARWPGTGGTQLEVSARPLSSVGVRCSELSSRLLLSRCGEAAGLLSLESSSGARWARPPFCDGAGELSGVAPAWSLNGGEPYIVMNAITPSDHMSTAHE